MLPPALSHPQSLPRLPASVLAPLRGAQSPRLFWAPVPGVGGWAADNASHTCWPVQGAPQLARATLLSRRVAPGRPPGGVGLGKGRGCPTRLSRSCVSYRLGAGSQGGGKGREGRGAATAAQVGEQHGFQVFGKPRVMAIARGERQNSLVSSPQRGLLALLGARSSQPPARGPGPCRVRDNRGGLQQPSLELGCSSAGPMGPKLLQGFGAWAGAGSSSPGSLGGNACSSLSGLARRGVNFLRLGLRAPRQQQVVLGPGWGLERAGNASHQRDGWWCGACTEGSVFAS